MESQSDIAGISHVRSDDRCRIPTCDRGGPFVMSLGDRRKLAGGQLRSDRYAAWLWQVAVTWECRSGKGILRLSVWL